MHVLGLFVVPYLSCGTSTRPWHACALLRLYAVAGHSTTILCVHSPRAPAEKSLLPGSNYALRTNTQSALARAVSVLSP
jgi:hypothetical protein